MIDPDGAGPGVAGMVTENGKAWQGLKSRFTSTATPYYTAGCDGITQALCPNEEASIYYQPRGGWDVLGMALMWQADNSYTGLLKSVKYHLNHVEKMMWNNPIPGFPCDVTTDACGVGSFADWGSGDIGLIAKAYDIVASQMTPAEKQRFANAMLNGWSGTGCDNQLVKQAGVVNVTGTTLTGSGLSHLYAAGDNLYLKTTPKWGATGTWATVVSGSAVAPR